MTLRQRAIRRFTQGYKAGNLFNAPDMRQFLFNNFSTDKYSASKLKEVLLKKISHLYYLANQGDQPSNKEGQELEGLVGNLEEAYKAYVASYQAVLNAANKELNPNQRQILKEYFRGLRE